MITGQDKFNAAFYLNELGQWTLRTPTGTGGSGSVEGGLDVPAAAKAVTKTRAGLVDTFNFYSDLAQTTLLKTISITYAAADRVEFTVEVTTP